MQVAITAVLHPHNKIPPRARCNKYLLSDDDCRDIDIKMYANMQLKISGEATAAPLPPAGAIPSITCYQYS